MEKKFPRLGKQTGQYMLIATMAGLLTACGGSGGSSDTTEEVIPLGDQDADNDDIINSLDSDADGDGLADFGGDDHFVDLDGDGLDDITLLTEAEAEVGGEGDTDGFTEVSSQFPCGSESGTDNSSATPAWNDNCLVERSLTGGQFADSLFSVGIQRVLYCSGYGSGSSYTVFADGEYGGLSEAAIEDFQTDEFLTPDGIVGENTWARLEDQLEVLDDTGDSRFVYGFTSGRCEGIPLFYQALSSAGVLGGWSLARNTPNEDQEIPFSYESPFGRL